MARSKVYLACPDHVVSSWAPVGARRGAILGWLWSCATTCVSCGCGAASDDAVRCVLRVAGSDRRARTALSAQTRARTRHSLARMPLRPCAAKTCLSLAWACWGGVTLTWVWWAAARGGERLMHPRPVVRSFVAVSVCHELSVVSVECGASLASVSSGWLGLGLCLARPGLTVSGHKSCLSPPLCPDSCIFDASAHRMFPLARAR